MKDRVPVILTICYAATTMLICFADEHHKLSNSKSNVQTFEKRFFKENCSTCHNDGHTGGCLGPVLAGEGQRRTKNFIESRITADPKKSLEFKRLYGHAELMQHKRVEPQMAKKLAEYIANLPATTNGFVVKSHGRRTSSHPLQFSKAKIGVTDVLTGKNLVYEKGCLQCHSYRGFGAQFGPAFDNVGSRYTVQQIANRITRAELIVGNVDSEYNERGIDMPPFGLTDSEIKSMSIFLSTLK